MFGNIGKREVEGSLLFIETSIKQILPYKYIFTYMTMFKLIAMIITQSLLYSNE